MLDLDRTLRRRLLRLQFLLRLMLVQFHLMGDLRVRLDLWLHDWDVHRVCLEFTSRDGQSLLKFVQVFGC